MGGGGRVIFMGDLAESRGSFELQPIMIRKQTRIEIVFILSKTLIQVFIRGWTCRVYFHYLPYVSQG
jgi:hypothetical protein